MKFSLIWRVPLFGIVSFVSLAACPNAASNSSASTATIPTGITVLVLDSLGGSTVAAATVSIVDSSGSQIGSYLTGSDGSVALTNVLAIGSVYSLTASAPGRAYSEMLNYTAQAGTTVALFSHPVAMSNVTAAPPALVSLQYSYDGKTWNTFGAGQKLTSAFQIQASVSGTVAVEATSWSGFGIKIDIDNMPTTGNGFVPTSLSAQPGLQGDGSYLSTAVFNLSTSTFVSGPHILDLVAYDVDNNRLEERLDFTIGTSNTSGGSLAAVTFSGPTLTMLSYGRSNSSFAFVRKGPTSALAAKALSAGSSASSYFADIEFSLSPSSTGILGFDVYRSSDGVSYGKIARVNYGALSTTASLGGPFTYDDYDSTLRPGTSYYYYVQAFNDDSHYSGNSPVMSAPFVAPFTATLVSPPSGTTLGSTASYPLLAFSISNAALWSQSAADYFYFSLYIRDKAGDPAFYGEYRYNFASGLFQAPKSYSSGVANWTTRSGRANAITVSGISYSGGTISINTSQACTATYANTASGAGGFSPVSGVAYEWDIFGDWASTSADLGTSPAMDPAYFVKDGSVTGGSAAVSGNASGVSYAQTYAGGDATINGSFDFIYP